MPKRLRFRNMEKNLSNVAWVDELGGLWRSLGGLMSRTTQRRTQKGSSSVKRTAKPRTARNWSKVVRAFASYCDGMLPATRAGHVRSQGISHNSPAKPTIAKVVRHP